MLTHKLIPKVKKFMEQTSPPFAPEPLVPVAGSAFEVAPIQLRFHCTHAVYAEGGDSSFCYVTSEERGEFIAAALDAWKASGGMQKWLDARLKPSRKKKP